MFASALVIEQEPLRLEDLPAAFQTWLLAAGGFAAIGVLIWLAARLLRGPGPAGKVERLSLGAGTWMSLGGGVVVALVTLLLPWVWYALGWAGQTTGAEVRSRSLHQLVLFPVFVGAGVALTAPLLPLAINFVRMRWRRVWALARLSMKEAIRSRILWAFAALLLVFLFGSWFIPYKAENQVRTYVEVVFFAMTVLLVFPATLLAAFSIPGDLRRQTIHTIVTKPVERFEIVLGRFLGFTLLMTLVLAVMSLFSLIYVNRQINEEAREESLKARVPVFGDLDVIGGAGVGKEWRYRRYIAGGNTQERATWTFHEVPRDLAGRDRVRCEFTFDIYRMLKDRPRQEGRGLYASFLFTNPRWKPELTDRFDNEWSKARERGEPQEETDNRLAREFGCYKARSVRVEDNHTLAIEVPGGLFQDVAYRQKSPADPAPLQVVVRFLSSSQFLGVARRDFYLVDADHGFNLNFFKGAAGIWFRLCLVIGLAVTCSTYLSGVISFLCTMFLYFAGLCLPFIQELAERKNVGGGPMESILRLSRESGPVMPLNESPAVSLAQGIDQVFTWFLRPFLYFLPDVGRFTLTEYVAAGFDISTAKLLVDNCLPLAGYLLPWAVLAYYLVRSREIAA